MKLKNKKRGGANPRRKGAQFERQVKKYLLKKGIFAVRQPRSAFPDIFAGTNGNIMFIECKMNKYITKQERTDLQNLALLYGGNAFIAYKEQREMKFCDVYYIPITTI